MAINFPDAPAVNDEFTAAGRTWIYDGIAWVGAPVSFQVEVADITDLTATATEINFVDGVTSAVQTQLDAKAEALPDLSDVTITQLATGEVLQYDGTEWVNSDVTISEVTGLSTALALKVDEVNGAVTAADTSLAVVRNITLATVDPLSTDGDDGDVWMVYTQ